MEPGSHNNKNNATRKVKFAPKVPPRRVPKPEVKTEVVENDDAVQAMDLLRRINEGSMKAKPKVERKVAPSQIAFGYGGKAISIKSYGIPTGGSGSNGSAVFNDGAHSSGLKEKKEYKEPWDYYSHYPVTIPLRRPYSGDPELLNEEEFGEASETVTYDENSTKQGVELGLTEDNGEPSMFFLQLPPTMPMIKRPVSANSHEGTGSSRPSGGARAVEKTCGLDELPAGLMGKMLVYRSGAVKLKLGDTIYDVTPGSDCVFAQDVVAINTTEKQCCTIGELNKRAILTPDLDSFLNCMNDL